MRATDNRGARKYAVMDGRVDLAAHRATGKSGPDVAEHILDASFEAHMAAADKIAAARGVERAALEDVALALAHAYGEAAALYAMAGGAEAHARSRQLGAVALAATQAMAARIHAHDCEGSA